LDESHLVAIARRHKSETAAGGSNARDAAKAYAADDGIILVAGSKVRGFK
jgi:hypothetical protein